MRLTPLGTNSTEVQISGRVTVLFSYSTPVAMRVNGQYARTTKRWSNTTERHINAWLDGAEAELVDQNVLDTFMEDWTHE